MGVDVKRAASSLGNRPKAVARERQRGSQKIAVVTDSCADVPASVALEYGIRVVPLQINYRDASYRDRVDIQPDEVYARFCEEIPKTSLPAPAEVVRLFDDLFAESYTHVCVVSISSGLSGTFDMMRSVAAGYAGMHIEVVDTRSIALGAGFVAIAAAQAAEAGMAFEQVMEAAHAAADRAKVFFCLGTLDYLYAGGRIGKVTHSLGTAFDIRPIVTCDDAGVYVTHAKAHGRKASLKKTVAAAQKALGDSRAYRIAIVHGDAEDEARAIYERASELFPAAKEVYFGQISPALVVHTGPGLVGIGVQRLD